MSENLKNKTISGVIWSAINQIGSLIIKSVFGIFMARLLMPSDFGLIGMVMVFINIANELMLGGNIKSYIQKKDTTLIHKASVFYSNITFSIFLYALFWILAPYIASFYNEPLLAPICRVLSLTIIIDALCAIHLAALEKEIDFRPKTILTIATNIIAGCIAVTLAIKGIGVWALVIYSLTQKILLSIGLWWNSKFIPPKYFSIYALREMFTFGSWMMLGTLFLKLFENINSLIIGKVYNASELGYYTKARDYQNSSSKQITRAFTTVAFPVFSKLNGNNEKLRNGIRNFNQHSQLAVLLVTTNLFVISTPFVMQILTPKWESTIIYIKLLCVIGAFFPINAVNVQYIIGTGKSRHNFFLIIIKNSLKLLNIGITYRYGVLYIVIGEVIISFFNLIFNTIYTNKSIDYGIVKQLFDIKYLLIGSVLASAVGYFSLMLIENYVLQLFAGLLITNAVFLGFQYLCNRDSIKRMKQLFSMA